VSIINLVNQNYSIYQFLEHLFASGRWNRSWFFKRTDIYAWKV